jgi:nicotinate phosphoribosyltransferase
MPGNAIFLVDTYDSLDGVRHAVEAGRQLRHGGHEMIGIRLDSGDLAELSIEARRILDQAGFPDAVIVASNDLDEHAITELKAKGAAIGVWGVGTRLVTGHPDAALGGVYKLSAIRDADGAWRDRVKLSDEEAKSSEPGILQVRRFLEGGRALADVIYDERRPPDGPFVVPPSGGMIAQNVSPPALSFDNLLVPVFRGGRRVGERPALEVSRRRAQDQLAMFDDGVKRLDHPAAYPVGLEAGLSRRKTEIILNVRKAEA